MVKSRRVLEKESQKKEVIDSTIGLDSLDLGPRSPFALAGGTVTKRKFLVCPFCQNKQYERLGRDEISSWCQFCGRCFLINWQEENE